MIEGLCRSSGRRAIFRNYMGYCFPEPYSIKNLSNWSLSGQDLGPIIWSK
jgi:hypothetical protein